MTSWTFPVLRNTHTRCAFFTMLCSTKTYMYFFNIQCCYLYPAFEQIILIIFSVTEVVLILTLKIKINILIMIDDLYFHIRGYDNMYLAWIAHIAAFWNRLNSCMCGGRSARLLPAHQHWVNGQVKSSQIKSISFNGVKEQNASCQSRNWHT